MIIIFRIVVLALLKLRTSVDGTVAVRKRLKLVVRVIQFKALELLGTQFLAGTLDLMLEAAHVPRRNCLGGTVVHLYVSAKQRCRKLQHCDNSLPDCKH